MASHGNKIVERVASVTYRTDTPLPDGYREVFELAVQLPEAAGTTLVFPNVQTCEQGESAWLETTQDGRTVEGLALPAPGFVVRWRPAYWARSFTFDETVRGVPDGVQVFDAQGELVEATTTVSGGTCWRAASGSAASPAWHCHCRASPAGASSLPRRSPGSPPPLPVSS